MPIYEYECSACKAAFEQLVRSSGDEKSAVCPECSSKRVTRKPSVFAAHGAAASKSAASLPRAGGCGRCGDPNGPCSVN